MMSNICRFILKYFIIYVKEIVSRAPAALGP